MSESVLIRYWIAHLHISDKCSNLKFFTRDEQNCFKACYGEIYLSKYVGFQLFFENISIKPRLLYCNPKCNLIEMKFRFAAKKNLFTLVFIAGHDTAQKVKSPIMDFFSKCDQIRRFLRIGLHLLKESVMGNFIFCAVWDESYFCSDLLIWCTFWWFHFRVPFV